MSFAGATRRKLLPAAAAGLTTGALPRSSSARAEKHADSSRTSPTLPPRQFR